MRFELIHLDGFGRLQGTSFNLAPGLNVFFGANEAGKSTLQQAIWALLYGFYKTDRRLQADSEQLERFRPWQGGAYGGHLIYRLDAGKVYRIARIFDDDDLTTSILEADTGRDVTNDYERGRLGRVAFARDQLGMSEEVFVNTCFVRQSDLHRLAQAAQAITETVVNLAGTGSQDRSVGQALESLNTALRDQVGTARARTKPMAQAQDRLDRFKREREVIIESRRLLDAEYDRRARLTTDRGQIEQDLVRLRFLLAVRHQALLDGRVGEIEQRLARKAELEGGLSAANIADDSLASQGDVIARLYQAWLSANANLEHARLDYESAQASESMLKQERRVLLDQQRPLEAARSIELEDESAVRKLYQTWREALQPARHASEAARQAKVELDELAGVRAKAQSFAPLLAVPQPTLADFSSRWATAEAELGAAESAFQTAHQAWQAQAISQQASEALQSRPQQLSADTLAVLRQREATVGQLKAQARQPLLVVATWGIAGGGLLALIAGILAILGVIGRAPVAVLVGGTILLLALLILGLGVAGLLLRRNREALWKAASEGLSADLKQWGSSDVATLAANNQAYVASQAPISLSVQAQEAVAAKRRALETIESEVRTTLRVPDSAKLSRADLESTAKSVEDVRGELTRLKDREDRWKPLDQAAQLLGSDLDKATTALRDLLQKNRFAGVDLDREVERFLELCENRRQLEQLDARLLTVDAKLEGLSGIERNYSNLATKVENARGNLLRDLKRSDIDEDDPALGFKQFQDRRDRAAATQERRSAVQALAREVQTLLAGQTLDEMKQVQAVAAREVEAWLAANRRLAGLTTEEAPEVLQHKLDELGERKVVVGQELATVEERLRSGEAGQRSLAEVDETIEEAQETIATLGFHQLALEAAIEHLTAAADEHHRDFLPRLNETVGRSLSRLTGGRYSNVFIDHHDLQIRLQVPGRPNPVTPDVLSRGAQEQIYLLLRLGLTELMSAGRERLPLILDDPLVNYDSERLLRGLDFLADLSAQTQILLFTKDESTAAWFRAQHGATQTNALHLL